MPRPGPGWPVRFCGESRLQIRSSLLHTKWLKVATVVQNDDDDDDEAWTIGGEWVMGVEESSLTFDHVR
jgi:hypothetical protein